ncbi:MAG: SurA N-terminal domain-containing protein [Gammaproteobacteria bacterium]|jgi:peptidyl-prolyl cis-trans isomerase D
MLLAIRERVMGIIGWVVLAVIFIAFAFFGLNSYLKSNVVNYAAAVNDIEIPVAQHQRAYQQLRARMRDMLGSDYDPALLDESVLKDSALQQLINDQLLLQESESQGFAVSDQLIAARIGSVDAFKEDGTFSKARYERVLRMQGMSPAEFQWRLGREIMTTQLRSGIVKTAAATSMALKEAVKMEAQQRRFRYLVLPVSRAAGQIEVTDREISDYYEAHTDDFMTPERVRIQYLELDAATLDTGAQPEEQAIEALYNEQSDRYVTEEQRHARHILVQLLPDADEAAIAEARQKAETLMQRLREGEAFDALAREESDDPGSAPGGGDLGFFSRGLMVPEFDEVVFAMEPGELRGPIRSSFGFHIIELLEIRPEQVTPLEAVRDQLVEQLLAEQRSDLYYDYSETLANLTFEQPDTLAGAAEALGLEIQESDWISQPGGGDGIAGIPAVVDTAFSEEVLLDGNNSTPVEIGDDHVIVMRVVEHQEASPQKLEDVRELVRKRIADEKARELTREQGMKLLAAVQEAGKTLEAVAEEEGLEVTATEMIYRRATKPDPGMVTAAFALPSPGDGSSPVYGDYISANGDFAIIALDEVRDGDFTKLQAAVQQQTRTNLSQVMGTAEMDALMDSLRADAVIQIPEQDAQQ